MRVIANNERIIRRKAIFIYGLSFWMRISRVTGSSPPPFSCRQGLSHSEAGSTVYNTSDRVYTAAEGQARFGLCPKPTSNLRIAASPLLREPAECAAKTHGKLLYFF
jgi:hypothetical protein